MRKKSATNTSHHKNTQINTENTPQLLVDKVEPTIPIARIIELRNKKLTYEEIATLLNCSTQNIHQRLQPFAKSIDSLPSIKENRADVLAIYNDMILNSLNPDEIKKAPARDKVWMYGVLYDKERLERGQTTSNVGYADYTRELRDLDKEILALEAELGDEISE